VKLNKSDIIKIKNSEFKIDLGHDQFFLDQQNFIQSHGRTKEFGITVIMINQIYNILYIYIYHGMF